MEIGFGYGILCDELEKQANEQGFTLGEESKKFEEFRRAINLLGINGILTDSEVNRAFARLQKKIVKALIRLKINYEFKNIYKNIHEVSPDVNYPIYFNIIDTYTRKQPDIEQIALKEDWAQNLKSGDMKGFFISNEGRLVLADNCGNYVNCPHERFKIDIRLSESYEICNFVC